jgi:heterodisulfide reductase subunit A-like polyferredoxin
MVRIGVFIDGLQGSIPTSFRERMATTLRQLPEVVFCVEEEHLNSPEGLERAAKHIREEEVDRVVVVGGSPRLYETSFQKSVPTLPLNPYLFAVANVREQALWTTEDEEVALKRAQTTLLKTIHFISCKKPIPSQSLPLKPEVLVIGGGVVGMVVALELASTGINVMLLEMEKRLGGKLLELRRDYYRPEDVQKWLEEKISEVERHPNITLLMGHRLKDVSGHLGRFQVRAQSPRETERLLTPSAIVVATGFMRGPKREGIFGYRRVINLATLEKLLFEEKGSRLQWEGKPVESVSFLLDTVNEDIKIDSIHAVKQGLLLQETFQCQVAILCKDVKVSADGMERLYRKAREKGVLFFKYEDPPKLSIVDGWRIQVDVKDTAAIRKEDQWAVSIPSDLLVLAEAIIPDRETKELCDILKIHLGPRGFFMEDNPQLLRVRSNRRGVFVAGACRFPQELSESLIEARAAAQEVVALLSRGTYPYDLAVAEVDPQKCAVCYTCPRLCPHAAITVEKYAERNVYSLAQGPGGMRWGAAKVDPAACYGCGICVAECPARAITLHHQTDEEIYAQMNLVE